MIAAILGELKLTLYRLVTRLSSMLQVIIRSDMSTKYKKAEVADKD